MNESHIIIAAVVSGIGGTVVTVFVVILCYWCLKRKKEKDEELVGDGTRYQTFGNYESVPGGKGGLKAGTQGPGNGKQQWGERPQGGKKSPMLTRKTIKYV
jgi:hypothetical protein